MPWGQDKVVAPPPAAGGGFGRDQVVAPLPEEEAPLQEPPVFSGAILPFSRSPKGETYFDPNAGLLGPVKRFGEAIGDTWRGSPVTEETIDKTIEGGLMATPMGPAARAVPLLPTTRAGALAPTAAQLKEAGGAGMTAARKMGVDFDPAAVASIAANLRTDLIENAINAKIAPKVFETLDELASPPRAGPGEQVVAQFSDLETARNVLRDARLDFTHPQQRAAAERAIAELDRLLEGRSPESVVAGPAAAAGERYANAKADYAAAKRSERLTGTAAERAEGKAGILPAAESRAGATHSGANLDNVIRQRVDALLDNPKLRAGFSEAEIAQLEKVSQGTLGRNTTRRIANLLGGGGGLGALYTGSVGAGIGGALAGPYGMAIGGAVAPATGMALKSAQNAMTKRALKAVDEAVRKRSPLYEELLKSPVVEKLVDPSKRAALVKALLAAAQEAQAAERASHTYGPGGNTL